MSGREYECHRLNADREIRLLTVFGGTGDASIMCKLTHHTLPRDTDGHWNLDPDSNRWYRTGVSCPEYEALSWAWAEGDKIANSELHIVTPGGLYYLSIQNNLYGALRHLRRPEESRVFWVDCVCIDQQSPSEKSRQVAMMSDIFRCASSVCIWLGEGTNDSNLALDFVEDLYDNLDRERITTERVYAPSWRALATLMNRKWFTRRWIVQEVSLARHATLHCGNHWVDWQSFERAVALFNDEAARISLIFRSDPQAEYDSDFLGEVSAMAASHLARVSVSLFRRDNQGTIVDLMFDLGDLVTTLTSFEAQEPNDMIFAILALARDTALRTTSSADNAEHQLHHGEYREDEQPADTTVMAALGKFPNHSTPAESRIYEVDYTLDFLEVGKRFLIHTAGNSHSPHSLDILCRPWAPRGLKRQLPSWMLTVDDSPFGRRAARHAPGGVQIMRRSFDPLVPSPYFRLRSPYKACHKIAKYQKDWYFGQDEGCSRSLFVTGFELDVVGEVSEYSHEGEIPVEWFEMADWDPWDSQSSASPPDQLWRTLIADRDYQGRNAPVYYPRVFQYAVASSTENGGLQTSVLSNRENDHLKRFLPRMKAVVWNRRLFKSDRERLLGLAPKAVKEGDRICILRGISVPVVLHPVGNHFTFVGECYLHTMMDGEAEERQEQLGLEPKPFELR